MAKKSKSKSNKSKKGSKMAEKKVEKVEQVMPVTQSAAMPDAAGAKSIVIAEGETTGHKHVAVGESIEVLTREDQMILNAPAGTIVTHDEHGKIGLPPGQYKVGRVQEHDYAKDERKAVKD